MGPNWRFTPQRVPMARKPFRRWLVPEAGDTAWNNVDSAPEAFQSGMAYA